MPDYPPVRALKKIRHWPHEDFEGWMAHIKSLWTYADCGFWSEANGVYTFSTGGWSGNEDIIRAMKKNTVLWMSHWYSHTRGGHYVFKTLDAHSRDLMEP